LHQALTAQQITHKMILHQGQHIYIHNMPSLDFLDMMNLWLSHHLYHIQNDVQALLPPIIYQDNRTPETWHSLQNWGSPTKFPKWYLGQASLCDKKASGTVTIQNQFPKAQFLTFVTDSKSWQEALTDETTQTAQRYLVKTPPLAKDCLLAGAAQVTLTVKSSVNFGMLSVQLVDFGKSKRLTAQPTTIGFKELALGHLWKTDDLKEFTLGESTPNKMIAKGHLNLQNRHHPWQTDDLVAGEYVTVQITLQPMLYHLKKGHQLGLIVYGTDFGMTIRGNQAIDYTISLADSFLELP
jgi:X-Pro dipeptidyl-peptidase